LIDIEKTPNNLADIIESEIEKHVPLLINEIYYDWQIIEELPGKQRVLIGAAPKSIVNQYTDILDLAKLSVEALEIEPMSICRSLLREEASNYSNQFKKNYAIIDFGAARTSMIIYSRNTILFTVSMPISGDKMTFDISKALKIAKDKAEKAKIVCGLDKSRAKGIVYKVLTKTISDLNSKINNTVEFYKNNFSDRGAIEIILLCGGGANIKGIDELITKAVDLPVKRGDSLINIGVAKDKFLKLPTKAYNLNNVLAKKDKEDSPKKKSESIKKTLITQDTNLTYATAFGLALRNIFID